MITAIAFLLIIAGIFLAYSAFKNTEKQVRPVGSFILGVASLALSMDYVFEDGQPNNLILLILIAAISISFALGLIFRDKKFLASLLIVPFLIGFPIFLSGDFDEHHYLGSQIGDNIPFAMLVILGLLAPSILHLILRLSRSVIEGKNKQIMGTALAFLFIGTLAALGNFILGPISILVVASFFLAASYLRDDKSLVSTNTLLNTANALFIIAAVNMLIHTTSFDGIDMTSGQVLEGIFVAGFIALFHLLFMDLAQKKNKTASFLMAVLVPLLAMTAFGLLYTQLERLGGLLTLGAMLMILAVIGMFYSALENDKNLNTLNLMTLGITLLLMPFITPVQQSSGIDLDSLGISGNAPQAKTEVGYHQKLTIPNGQDLALAEGNWTIDEEVSKIFFELGPKDGRVKGEFRNITGDFKVKDLNNSQINVQIPVMKLTTFNSIRDDELKNDKEFFDGKKFPELTYSANSFTQKEDGYILSGDFTMLETTQTEEVELKIVGVGEKDGKKVLVLWGMAAIDRTEYGMEPSDKIGNVVDFHFEVQLTEK